MRWPCALGYEESADHVPRLQLAPAAQPVCRSGRESGGVGVRHVLAVASANDYPYASQESAKTPRRAMTEEQAYQSERVAKRTGGQQSKRLDPC